MTPQPATTRHPAPRLRCHRCERPLVAGRCPACCAPRRGWWQFACPDWLREAFAGDAVAVSILGVAVACFGLVVWMMW